MKQFPFYIEEERISSRHGKYYIARFRSPENVLGWIIGTGYNPGEAIRDLKSARRDAIRAFIHWGDSIKGMTINGNK
jgi:hypothetical protein